MMYGLQNDKMVTNVHPNVPARVYGSSERPFMVAKGKDAAAPNKSVYEKVAGITHFSNNMNVAVKDETSSFLRDSTIMSRLK